ncbi:MAG: hypothetical protein ACXWG1_02245 [Usitatibacter sp.]
MKTLFAAISAIAALALAGCATTDGANEHYAQADCKIYPVTTASATGVRAPKADSMEQRAAEADLAGSGYRFRNLQRNGMAYNNVEELLRDCNR